MRTRVMLAGESTSLGDALRELVEAQPDMDVLWLHTHDALSMTEPSDERPDVVVIWTDLDPGVYGRLGPIRRIRDALPAARVVVVSLLGDPRLAAAALDAGASAYLLVQHADTELIEAVHAVAMGRTYLGQGIRRLPGPARSGTLAGP